MNYSKIENEKQYKIYLKAFEELMEINISTGSIEDIKFAFLEEAIIEYEDKNYKIDKPEPIEAIKFRMDQQNLYIYTKPQITILYDHTNNRCLSYIKVKDAINNKEDYIETNCLSFFNFTYLDKGYEVVIYKENGNYIRLSELLENNPGEYIQKEIRITHNVYKMFIAGSFEWKTK